MSVVARAPYEFPPLDAADKFHGNQLLYINWEDHLMFCAPFALCLPPATPFKDVQNKMLADLYGCHPDFARIDWSKVQWLKSGKPWQPKPEQSLAGNGLKHKDVIRFRTPGLTGIGGSCS